MIYLVFDVDICSRIQKQIGWNYITSPRTPVQRSGPTLKKVVHANKSFKKKFNHINIPLLERWHLHSLSSKSPQYRAISLRRRQSEEQCNPPTTSWVLLNGVMQNLSQFCLGRLTPGVSNQDTKRSLFVLGVFVWAAGPLSSRTQSCWLTRHGKKNRNDWVTDLSGLMD